MDKYATRANIKIEGVYQGEVTFTPTVNYSMKYLYTGYNGRCQAYTFHEVLSSLNLGIL